MTACPLPPTETRAWCSHAGFREVLIWLKPSTTLPPSIGMVLDDRENMLPNSTTLLHVQVQELNRVCEM